MKEGTEPTVSFGLGMLLMGTALCFDGSQWISELTELIPVAGQILALILNLLINGTAILVFGAILYFSEFSILTLRRGGSLIVTTLIELIPVINTLPAWTLWATIFILTNKVQELTEEMA